MNYLVASQPSLISLSTSERVVSHHFDAQLFCLVQLYLPPEYMMNKDFLKEIFVNEKRLLKLNEVQRINVPLYDELSVMKLWPMMKQDE